MKPLETEEASRANRDDIKSFFEVDYSIPGQIETSSACVTKIRRQLVAFNLQKYTDVLRNLLFAPCCSRDVSASKLANYSAVAGAYYLSHPTMLNASRWCNDLTVQSFEVEFRSGHRPLVNYSGANN